MQMTDLRVPNRLMGGCLLVVAIHALGGCPAPAPVVPTVDATDAASDSGDDAAVVLDAAGTQCMRACATLKKLGCPEAETPDGGDTCVTLCQRAQDTRKFDMRPQCVSDAGSVEQLRACGTVRCKK
jgi:hypothetical protein